MHASADDEEVEKVVDEVSDPLDEVPNFSVVNELDRLNLL